MVSAVNAPYHVSDITLYNVAQQTMDDVQRPAANTTECATRNEASNTADETAQSGGQTTSTETTGASGLPEGPTSASVRSSLQSSSMTGVSSSTNQVSTSATLGLQGMGTSGTLDSDNTGKGQAAVSATQGDRVVPVGLLPQQVSQPPASSVNSSSPATSNTAGRHSKIFVPRKAFNAR